MPRHLRHALAFGTCLVACAAPPPKPVATSPPRAEIPTVPALVPAPSSIVTCASPAFVISPASRVSGPRDVASHLERWFGLPASAAGDPVLASAGSIELHLLAPDTSEPAREIASIEAQSFTLEVDSHHAVISSRGRAGLFYGAQTLAQIAGARLIEAPDTAASASRPTTWSVPCVKIEDRPRFAFRAMHLDVARHFFDANTVERYVDLLAFYRFNVFHWHLTDDQGFRLSLPRHPELASPEASYSRDEILKIVGSARDRFITVVPEIEMPGHARAVLAAHPELSCTGTLQTTPRSWGIFDDVLCAGNPDSLHLMKSVLDEVTAIFPSKMIHVGGDEVPPTRWNACLKCQAAMKAAKVDAIGLEHVFMEQIFQHLASQKRRPMVWDEALPVAAPTAMVNPPVIVAWQSKARGDLAASRGFDTVYAPYESVYFNFSHTGLPSEPGHVGPLPLDTVRAFEPKPGPHILGGEGALWTEYVWSRDDIDALVLPRGAALADALWSGKRDDFEVRFRAPSHLALLDRSQVSYFIDPPREPGGLRVHARRVVIDEATMRLEPPAIFRTGTIRYTRDGSTPTASSPRYRDPLQVTDTTTIRAALFLPSGRSSPVVETKFVKEAPRPAFIPAGMLRKPRCSFYEGSFHRLSQVPADGEGATVVVDAISLDAILEKLPNARDHFALRCEGTISIPNTGVHRFIVKSDDGARLVIDGEPVVEIDGDLGPREYDGEIALAAGPHRIDVLYFQGTEGKELRIETADSTGQRLPLRYR